MTARHATPLLAIELEAAGDTRALTLRDRTGFGEDALILDLRPNALSSPLMQLTIETWAGVDGSIGSVHLTAMQLRAIGSLCIAAAEEAEARK